MSYAIQADLEQFISESELIGLTDDEDTGAVVTSRIEASLETASVTIDGYLGSRYSLPFSDPPQILNKLCVDIAGHLLHIRRNEISESWGKRHDNAISFLEKVNNGKLSLGVKDPAGTGSDEKLRVDARAIKFSEEELDKY